jgi:outer membrane protein assembly factor BamA
LSDFKTGTSLNVEEYEPHFFNRIELDWEEYFRVPYLKHHALALRIRGGLIDRPVDDFFYLFAGGLIGMKGYSYYSLSGTKKLIGTATYRFPLFDDIDWQLFTIYFSKLYFGVFYDYGYAWDSGGVDFKDFKRDIGFQFRLDTFSNFLFPTRIFWEAVYPFDTVNIKNVTYTTDWRFYFGLLFEFDIRERFGNILRRW